MKEERSPHDGLDMLMCVVRVQLMVELDGIGQDQVVGQQLGPQITHGQALYAKDFFQILSTN
jgi:hypothetical protein